MKRRLLALAMGASLSLATATMVGGTTVGTSPSYQTHAHGAQSSWTLTWGGMAPFSVFFAYDNNVPSWNWSINGTSTTSKALSATFYPCSTTTFQQRHNAIDATHNGGTVYTNAQELGGLPC